MTEANVGLYGEVCVERHTALIYDRGGKQRLFQIDDLNKVGWERAQDRKTAAQIAVTGRACRAQSKLLNSIEPRRHELVLFRGSERVWEGPITQAKSTSDRFVIDAFDIIDYLDHTALSKAWPSPDGGGQPIMTERLREIITYELTHDHDVTTGAGVVTIPGWENLTVPANLVDYLDIALGTTLTRSDTVAFEMTLGEHLYNLGRSVGVSYTTVGRALVIWDGTLARTRTVTEKDFSGDFEVVSSGSDFYNVAHVVADAPDPDTDPVVGHAANDMSYYGPWAKILNTTSEDAGVTPTSATLNSQARTALRGRYPVPIEVIAANGSNLIPSPGLTMAQLVAGTDMPVRARKNIRDVKQLQRLNTLKVTETSAGETISANLVAVGEAVLA